MDLSLYAAGEMIPPKSIISKKGQPRLPLDGPDHEETIIVPKPPTSPAVVESRSVSSKQLLILASCRFSEPISMTSSFPYLFFMIRDFHLSDDEKEIGRYAGLLASSFTLAQFVSGWVHLGGLC